MNRQERRESECTELEVKPGIQIQICEKTKWKQGLVMLVG